LRDRGTRERIDRFAKLIEDGDNGFRAAWPLSPPSVVPGSWLLTEVGWLAGTPASITAPTWKVLF